jgi:hypothetical protein
MGPRAGSSAPPASQAVNAVISVIESTSRAAQQQRVVMVSSPGRSEKRERRA